ECPEGVVHEDSFKDIYAKFFPHGNSSLYAHYVFKAFDVNSNGAISFRDLLVTLSTLLRGSIYEKLRWTFKLYDINGDGCITRAELAEIVVAIHELMGRRAHQLEDDRKAREQVDRVFKKLDLNQDGVITIEEFIESCLKEAGTELYKCDDRHRRQGQNFTSVTTNTGGRDRTLLAPFSEARQSQSRFLRN
ncbi:hypothetical protein Cfor_03655, partial [Coptotermes formosanus]